MTVSGVFSPSCFSTSRYPLLDPPVKAGTGFPSPAQDFAEKSLDLNDLLVYNPVATYCVRVQGDSMTGAGIHDRDILMVDCSLEARSGDVVVAVLDGEMLVKRLRVNGAHVTLLAENPHCRAVEVGEGQDFWIWGVVTHVIHSL